MSDNVISGTSRFRKANLINDRTTGRLKLSTVKRIDIPVRDSDIYIEMKITDRLDKISFDVYGDYSLWWILCWANNLLHPYDFEPGDVLRIPKYKENVFGAMK
jgi:hypothetical protein